MLFHGQLGGVAFGGFDVGGWRDGGVRGVWAC